MTTKLIAAIIITCVLWYLVRLFKDDPDLLAAAEIFLKLMIVMLALGVAGVLLI